MEHFANRVEAGERLAARLVDRVRAGTGAPTGDAVVLGLPRGGVPVAARVADALDAPLDVLVVRKLGTPGHAELAMGAIGEESAIVRNDDVIASARVDRHEFDEVLRRERAELDARVERFRGVDPPVPLAGRTAIVVDDGVATGATMRVACRVARARGAARVVVAVPVAAPDSLADLRASPGIDDVVCLSSPPGFMAVGMHYLDFRQTSDDEVAQLLAERPRG